MKQLVDSDNIFMSSGIYEPFIYSRIISTVLELGSNDILRVFTLSSR
jgi:hypothetical protein